MKTVDICGNASYTIITRNVQTGETKSACPEKQEYSKTSGRNKSFIHIRRRGPVSYTHLDVYKRQIISGAMLLKRKSKITF